MAYFNQLLKQEEYLPKILFDQHNIYTIVNSNLKILNATCSTDQTGKFES